MTGKQSVEITREWIAHAIRESDSGPSLPPDAELVGLAYCADRDMYRCVFISDAYDEVAEGAMVAEWDDD